MPQGSPRNKGKYVWHDSFIHPGTSMSNNKQQLQQSPQWAIDFLYWFCKSDLVEEIEGDIQEIYHRLALLILDG